MFPVTFVWACNAPNASTAATCRLWSASPGGSPITLMCQLGAGSDPWHRSQCEYCRPDGDDCSADGSKRCQVVEIENKATGEMQTQFALNSAGETVPVAFCIEKNLFDPFTWKDVVATIIAFVSTALGSGCGVGGGGLLVPMYVFFYGLSPKHAIPLSKATIFGNAIREKESKHQLAVMKSVLKGGPEGGGRGRQWSIYRIAAHRWLAKTRRNKKLREIRVEDEEDFKSLPPLREHQPSSSDPLLGGLDKHGFGTFVSDDDQNLERRSAIEQREMRLFPLKYIVPLVISWLVVLVQSMLRGGHGAPSIIGISCNSPDYWMLTFLPMLILVAFALWVGYQLRLLNRTKVLCDYPFVEGDIHWIKRRTLVFPTLCTMAGVAAGLLGIGGGMVKGPIMLEMGILPAVQSATANFMILFTSSSTTLQFAINGQFPGERQYDYIAWFALIGCIGGLCGQKVVAYLVKKYKRESIMVYLLATTIGLSALAMGIIGLKSTLSDIEKGVNLGFHGICDNE
ncbi:unnamed protein product [Phytophthora fragariaefolia]|uniref:Unnamed protein product n=1 Tax=Phytophthora fragariaefolia TaxID=1490495 RepID=A0A9W6TR41_9STRA|nr:unnamed protein product [Phytophthora fragariaefolia]